jgi:ZIP family zinc transporter
MIILQAGLAALVITSTLLIGTWIAFTHWLSSRVVGIIMGFGSGALIAAVAYEMFPETSRDLPAFICLALGAIVFYLASKWLEGRSGAEGKEGVSAQAQAGQQIVVGALLDVIPECLTLGMGIAVGGGLISIAFIVSMLIATLPFTIGASAMMEAGGTPRRQIWLTWLFVMAVCVISAMAGAVLIQLLPQLTGVYAMAVAAGALLAMTTVSMLPEALKETGLLAGLMTVLGFAFTAGLGAFG